MGEIGLVTFQRTYDAATGGLATCIASADPRIRVSTNFLDGSGRYPFLDPYVTVDGDVLTIRDDCGQRFIYRIRWDDHADGGYLAEWPD